MLEIINISKEQHHYTINIPSNAENSQDFRLFHANLDYTLRIRVYGGNYTSIEDYFEI